MTDAAWSIPPDSVPTYLREGEEREREKKEKERVSFFTIVFLRRKTPLEIFEGGETRTKSSSLPLAARSEGRHLPLRRRRVQPVSSQHGQRGGADESRGGGQTGAQGHGAVDQDLERARLRDQSFVAPSTSKTQRRPCSRRRSSFPTSGGRCRRACPD